MVSAKDSSKLARDFQTTAVWVIFSAFTLCGSSALSAVPLSEHGAAECLQRLSPADRQFEQSLGQGVRLISRGSKSGDRFYLASDKNLRDLCGRKGKRTAFDKVEIPSFRQLWVGVSFDCSSSTDASVRKGVAVVGAFRNGVNR
jgi:hypothetical protein